MTAAFVGFLRLSRSSFVLICQIYGKNKEKKPARVRAGRRSQRMTRLISVMAAGAGLWLSSIRHAANQRKEKKGHEDFLSLLLGS